MTKQGGVEREHKTRPAKSKKAQTATHFDFSSSKAIIKQSEII